MLGLKKTNLWLGLFLISALILSLLGVLFVFEASLVESLNTFGTQYFIIKHHLLGLGLGLIGFLLLIKLPTHWYLKFAPSIYAGNILLLLLTFFPTIGLKLNGARRWLDLGLVRFQPTEALKFSLVLLLVTQLSQATTEKERLAKFLTYLGIPSLIMLLQPDLGSLLLTAFIAVVIYFLVGGSIKSLTWLTLGAVPLVILAIMLAPYRLQRLTTFLHPSQDPLGSSFHIRQINLALGRGSWFGVGIGNSKQKYAYIPEAATDSIFAIIGEELGFVGGSLILMTYLVFFFAGTKLILRSSASSVAQLVGVGFLIIIAAQTCFNLGAVVGLIPLTGMPLPFISYGRSSQIMIWLGLAYIVGLQLQFQSNRSALKRKRTS